MIVLVHKPVAQKTKNNFLVIFFLKLIATIKAIKKQTTAAYLLFFIISACLLIIYNKETLHLLTNKFHTKFLDLFFKYATYLGDGVMFGVLAVLFFFIKRKMTLVFVISGFLTLLITFVFKKLIFKGVPRPASIFGVDNLHIIDGVKMAFWNSFPSGHTTTAFAIFTILCLYFNKCASQYLWLSLAIIAGLSRVYLSQHFLMDVFVGSGIGVLIGLVSMTLFQDAVIRKIH